MAHEEDTITAIATAQGPAGIAIVRVSGPDAFTVAEKVAGKTPDDNGRLLRARYATFRNPTTGEAVDDGILLLFRAPHSYTGEDVAELQGHGGRMPSARLLDAAIAAGARPAEPGEFTRRAFLNGKLDLARAEAVMDFIGAASERAAAVAREQIDGKLSKRADVLFDAIVAIEADVEHLLDFDEGEVDAGFAEEAARRCRAAADGARQLAAGWRTGAYLREGALAVICGRPNAGKSSLLNALLGRDRAIVSPVAGTTRDAIEEATPIRGIPVRLVDTAGLRETADGIEAEGVARAEALIRRADLVLEVIDCTAEDAEEEAARAAERGRIAVMNKSDLKGSATLGGGGGGLLPPAPPDDAPSCPVGPTLHYEARGRTTSGRQQGDAPDSKRTTARGTPPTASGQQQDGTAPTASGQQQDGIVAVSAKTGEGIEALKEEIGARLDNGTTANGEAVSARHRECLEEAARWLASAEAALEQGDEGLVAAAEGLALAAQAAGRITGRVWGEELLDAVFGKFCVGK